MQGWRGGTVPERRWTRVALAAVACVLLAACGARWSTEERSAVLARRSDAGPAGPVSGEDVTATSLADVGVASPAATGGTGPVPSDPASTNRPAGPSASGPRPCAAPSSAPGVSPTELVVGSISSLSGPVPGFGANGAAGIRAYVAHRNATGGVCGRKLVLKTADDGTEQGRYRAAIIAFNDSVLGIVGGTTAGDAGGVERVEALGMPVVSATFSVEMGHAATAFDITPTFKDTHKAIGKYDFLHQQGIRKAAVVGVANALTRAEMLSQRDQMQASGIQVVNFQELPLSTLSYDASARAVANSGADFLLFIHEPGASASMAKAMRDTGYRDLRFAEYITAYGSAFIELGGEAVEGALGFARTAPNEDASPGPNQMAFLQWMARSEPGNKADTFAADSWAAATGFFDALEALPGPITRAGLIAQLRTMTSFDAEGFMGPINLGESASNGCGVWMQVKDQRWQRLTPAQGFLC
jgi:ABC-type branched-subunit amino acid transport system substrate-binding protein